MAATDVAQYLRQHWLFEAAEDAVVRSCGMFFAQDVYAAKSMIFDQGDPAIAIHLVRRGQVRLGHVIRGRREATLSIRGPGDMIGEDVVFKRERMRPTRAVAVSDVFVCSVTIDNFCSMLRKHGVVSFNLCEYMQRRCDEALDLVRELTASKVSDRILGLLRRLGEAHGIPDADGTLLDLRLTHSQIGSLVGSTRETTSLAIGELVRSGQLQSRLGAFVLPASPPTVMSASTDNGG